MWFRSHLLFEGIHSHVWLHPGHMCLLSWKMLFCLTVESLVHLKNFSLRSHWSLCLSSSSCVLRCHFKVAWQPAGGQGSCEGSWFPPGVTQQLRPHSEITFTISQTRHDIGATGLLYNCISSHRVIDYILISFRVTGGATFQNNFATFEGEVNFITVNSQFYKIYLIFISST